MKHKKSCLISQELYGSQQGEILVGSWNLIGSKGVGHCHTYADTLNHISLKSNIIECINIFLVMNDVLGKCGISNGNL